MSETLKKYFLNLNLTKHTLLINCNTPKFERLTLWLSNRCENMKIVLDESSRNLLCSHYENDINGLNQILYQLSIIYHNTNPNYINVKNLMVDTSSHFNLEYLLDSILQSDKKRSRYILQQLQSENIVKPLTILHTIQHMIFLLIIFQRQLLLNNNKKLLISLFHKYKIKKNRHLSFTNALQHITLKQLYQVLTLLLQIEITIHQEYSNIIWHNLELSIWLLCGKIKSSVNNL